MKPILSFVLGLALIFGPAAFFLRKSQAEQLKPGRELENPFPPAPSGAEARIMLDGWAREDTASKLSQILVELTKLRAEVRLIRKAQCQCAAGLSPPQ